MTDSHQQRVERGRAVRERNGARCKSCQARVVWVITTRGKAMPIDADQVPTGNIRLTGRTRADRYGRSAPEVEYTEASSLFTEEVDEPRYVSHFATCPNAAEHRSRPGGAR